MLETYKDIQTRIDYLYNTQWFQSNASYPVTLFYTDQNVSTSDFTIDAFLKMHVNSKPNDSNILQTIGNTPKTIKDYMETEQQVENSGIRASDSVLRQFSKVSGLKSFSIPLAKKNGALGAISDRDDNSLIRLEFLCDKDFNVLKYIQAWQSRWYTYDFEKRSLAQKTTGAQKEGGEGYLGIANCLISLDGNITVNSHLSLFGLIPQSVELPNEWGPRTSPKLNVVTVTCLYAHAILVYQRTSNSLGFYYFK